MTKTQQRETMIAAAMFSLLAVNLGVPNNQVLRETVAGWVYANMRQWTNSGMALENYIWSIGIEGLDLDELKVSLDRCADCLDDPFSEENA